jgi:hypothetical protein
MVVAIRCCLLAIVGRPAATRCPVIGLRLGTVAISRGPVPLLGIALAGNGSLTSAPSALLTLPVRFAWLGRRIVFSRRHQLSRPVGPR